MSIRTPTDYNDIRNTEAKRRLRDPHEDILDIEGPQKELTAGIVVEGGNAIPVQPPPTVDHRYPRRERQVPDRYGEWVNN